MRAGLASLVMILASLPVLSFAEPSAPIRIGLASSRTFSELIDGECRGIFCDRTQQIFREGLGLEVEIVVHPWQRIQRQVEKGEIDVMFALPTEERRSYGLVSKLPIHTTVLRIFTHANHPKLSQIENIQTVNDIKELGLISVTNQGNGWHANKVEGIGVKTIHVKDDVSILKMITARRGDITIDATNSMRKINKMVKYPLEIDLGKYL